MIMILVLFWQWNLLSLIMPKLRVKLVISSFKIALQINYSFFIIILLCIFDQLFFLPCRWKLSQRCYIFCYHWRSTDPLDLTNAVSSNLAEN